MNIASATVRHLGVIQGIEIFRTLYSLPVYRLQIIFMNCVMQRYRQFAAAWIRLRFKRTNGLSALKLLWVDCEICFACWCFSACCSGLSLRNAQMIRFASYEAKSTKQARWLFAADDDKEFFFISLGQRRSLPTSNDSKWFICQQPLELGRSLGPAERLKCWF